MSSIPELVTLRWDIEAEAMEEVDRATQKKARSIFKRILRLLGKHGSNSQSAELAGWFPTELPY